MLTIGPRMVSILSHSLISFEHMSFWYPFLEPYLTTHLTTYHSNEGIPILAMLELGASAVIQMLAP